MMTLNDEYQRLKARLELLEILAESEDDVKNNRLRPAEHTFSELRSILEEKYLL